LKVNRGDLAARAAFEMHKQDLGYGLLLKRELADPRTATQADIDRAAWRTVPNVPVMFWIFRIMAGIGFFLIGFFALAFYFATTNRFDVRWFLRASLFVMPLPWIAIEFGWVLSEIGRQPWAIEGVLPTFLGASSLTIGQIWTTIIGFTLLYGTLAVIEIRLMLLAIRKGPYVGEPVPTAGPSLLPTPVSSHGYAALPAE
jgi:cytochrome d ubiquinol oxidase subunit I